MDVLGPYPDAEQVALDLLEAIAPTVTALPPDITAPVIKCARVGGIADRFDDDATVVVGSYALDRATAWANARAAQQVIIAARGQYVNGAQVDTPSVLVGLQQLPYSPTVFHVTGTYRMTFRRPRM